MPQTDNVSQSSIHTGPQDMSVLIYRSFSWISIAVLFSYLINNYLTHWLGWPGATTFLSEKLDAQNLSLSLLQFISYVAVIGFAVAYVIRTSTKTLREDSSKFYAITAYIIRAAFWAVLLVGLFDTIISFLRVENVLSTVVGSDLAEIFSQKKDRGIYLHIPLIVLSFIIALFMRGLGFVWLALLVVVAELIIVLAGAMYSYEQTLFGDLVRFWYAALFLFASAHTLLEDGHVRVDLVYAGLSKTKKGIVNAWGSILLGMSLCWVIIFYGMQTKHSIINAAILSFEVTQQEYGLKVKYWMAAFLGIFAVSMLIQFSGYFLESLADYRGEHDDKDEEKEPEQTGTAIS